MIRTLCIHLVEVMKKQTIHIFIVLEFLLLIGAFFLFLNIEARFFFGVEKREEKKLQEITVGMEQVNILKKRLRISGHEVPYDSVNDIFLIPQSLDDNRWVGVLSLDDGGKEKGQLFFCEDDDEKSESIESGKIYKLYYIDEENNVYQKANVVFSGLPIMEIKAENVCLISVDYGKIERTDFKAKLVKRGASSLYYEKPSYKLNVKNNKVQLLTMRKDDDWILNALYDDMGLIHNKFSYDVWSGIAASEEVGNNSAASSKYIELIKDGEYLGVYALSERVDDKSFALKNDEMLYKIKGWPWDDGSGVVVLKYPKEASLETDSVKTAIMDNYAVRENGTGFFEKKALVNYENAIDYHIFCQLSCAADNMFKNSYLVVRKYKDFYYFCEVPWDCNITWGIHSCVNTDKERVRDTTFGSTVGMLLEDSNSEEFNRDVANRWFELREEVLSKEKLDGYLKDNLYILHNSGAYDRNYRRWPTVTVNPGEKKEVIGVEINQLWDEQSIYDFVSTRLDILDEYYSQYL